MKYHYFISYFSISKKDKTQAISRAKLTQDNKIKSWDDILKIEKTIEQEFERKDVVILNFVLLKKGKG